MDFMAGILQTDPMRCAIGDYVVASDFTAGRGSTVHSESSMIATTGTDETEWTFVFRSQHLVGCCDVTEVWERVS